MARTCTPARRFATFVLLVTMLVLLNAAMLYRLVRSAGDTDTVDAVSVVKVRAPPPVPVP
jgi:hypothetical protein